MTTVRVTPVFAALLMTAGWWWCPGRLDGAPPRPKINRDAYELARLLRPGSLSAKTSENDLAAVEKQVIAVLELLERSQRSNGPPADDLLDNAYDLFLEEVDERRKIETRQAVLQAWEDARALGLFGEDGTFSREITRGLEAGQDCVFEYIVPAEVLPLFSRDPANIRIVAPSRKRQGDELSEREKALRANLEAIGEQAVSEAQSLKREEKELRLEELEPWEKEMEAAGDEANAQPMIRLDGRITGTPSQSNGDRYRVSLEAHNASRHPTEIAIECYFLGITGEKRIHYSMGREEQTVKLRAGEIWKGDFFSKPQNSFFKLVAKLDDLNPKNKKERKLIVLRGRGWVARVLHDGELVQTAASMNDLLPYVHEEFGELQALP